MAGFEELRGAVDLGAALAPLTVKDVSFDEGWDDDTALGIVIADVNTAIAFEQAKNFFSNMEQADDLVRQYVRVRPWPNTDKPRSALGMPVVVEAIEKILPALHMAIWGSGKDPFQVEPIGNTTAEAARARQHILRWAIKHSDFKEGSRLTMKNILTYGYGLGTVGWASEEKEIRKYKLSGDGRGVERDFKKKTIVCPTYEAANLRNIVIDSACQTQDPRKGKFYAKRIPVTAYDLDGMRDDPTYNYPDSHPDEELRGKTRIPSREDLARILVNKEEPTVDSMQGLKGNESREFQAQKDTLPTSKDPLAQPLELLEYWTKDRVVTVLQKKIVIRNEQHDFGKLNLFGCAFIDILNSAFGFGISKLLAGEQRLQQGVLNTWIDSLALILNPVFQMAKSVLGSGGQNISIAPGKVVTTEGELKPLVTPSVSQEAMGAIEASEVRSNRRVGAEGGSNTPTQALRTGSGVQAFQGDVTQRLQYFLEIYIDLLFVPVLESFLELCADKLTPDEINEILVAAEGKAYQGSILNVYNAETQIQIIAGTKLIARQAAAQIVPMITQLVANEAVQDALVVQGTKFEFSEFAKEYFELMGWDIDALFVPMTPDDQQRAQQMNPAAARAQGEMQLQSQKHKDELDSIDAKASVAVETAVVKQTLKSHLESAAQGDQQSGQ